MKKFVFFLLVSAVSLSSCNKDYYQVKSFYKKTEEHKEIAILPVEIIFSGLQPFDLTEEDVQKQEEGESRAFQISLHSELLKRKENSSKGPKLKLQRVSQTNKIIQEKMTIRESWELTAEEMAELLGVDAVVKSRIEKKRYFSDLASYGIDVASKIIGLLAKDITVFLTGQSLKKSNDIYGRYELLDGTSGETLWSMSYEEAANYKNPADQVINSLNEKAAKNFPYKK